MGWWAWDSQSHLSLAMPLRASASLAPSNANATATATVIGRGCKTNPRRMCCCRPEHFTFTGTYSRCRTRAATLQLHFCSAKSEVPEAGKASEKEICSRTKMLRPEISHHITSCPFPSRKYIVTVTVVVVFCACQGIQGWHCTDATDEIDRLS